MEKRRNSALFAQNLGCYELVIFIHTSSELDRANAKYFSFLNLKVKLTVPSSAPK
jgi:hypothetical protein